MKPELYHGEKLNVEGALAPYVSLGLISKDASEVVKAFLPMNAYGLYYAFASVEMLHAVSASYAYERYRSVLATALLRALTVAFHYGRCTGDSLKNQ